MPTDVATREHRVGAVRGQGLAPTGWLSDLVRLEIVLWNRMDARLRGDHDLSLAQFASMSLLAAAADGALRVGELATAMRITVGGASKVADRLVTAGLVRRRPDPTDGRASVLVLTAKGRRKLAVAAQTHEEELADALGVLDAAEIRQMHALVQRLLEGNR